MLFFSIAAISIPFSVIGIAFLIWYFIRRKKGIKQSKAGIILPVISLCIGELFIAPIGALIALIILNNFTKTGIILAIIFAAIIFVIGVFLIILSAVKALRGKMLKSSLLLTSIIIFLAGFEMFAMFAMYGLAWLIL